MEIFEYRGVEGLVYAEVTKDNNSSEQGEGYVTGTVKELAGVAEISKSTESSSEAHYYDNIPAVVITSTGADTITINTSGIPLDVLADITGQTYDSATGTFIEEERTQKYFSIGYKTKATNGDEMYVWRLKGTFNIPDQTSATENDGTDANGQELTFTGISTTHKFTKTGKPAKAVTVNTGLGLADVTNFFDSVQTPDTIAAATTTPSVTVIPSRIAMTAGSKVTLESQVVPAGTSVAWSSSSTSYASVNASTGEVTAVAAGTATITATITVDGTDYTDTCTVVVSAASA